MWQEGNCMVQAAFWRSGGSDGSQAGQEAGSQADGQMGPPVWSGGARVCEAGVPPRVGLESSRCVRPVCPPGEAPWDWAGYVWSSSPSCGPRRR